MTNKSEVHSEAVVVKSYDDSTTLTVEEQAVVAQIQQLWPSARKSGKELGEQLFKLRELCREKESRFDLLLKSLDIPRSTAYHYIGIFEECQLVDFEFPANIVRFATTAGIDLANLGQRKTLLTAFQEAGSPGEPNDGAASTSDEPQALHDGASCQGGEAPAGDPAVLDCKGKDCRAESSASWWQGR